MLLYVAMCYGVLSGSRASAAGGRLTSTNGGRASCFGCKLMEWFHMSSFAVFCWYTLYMFILAGWKPYVRVAVFWVLGWGDKGID